MPQIAADESSPAGRLRGAVELLESIAADYYNDGVHMNNVDTGWITDEDPVETAARGRVVGPARAGRHVLLM